ncbi:MAG: hypothetical protein ACOYB3_07755 [Azonexus sp.]
MNSDHYSDDFSSWNENDNGNFTTGHDESFATVFRVKDADGSIQWKIAQRGDQSNGYTTGYSFGYPTAEDAMRAYDSGNFTLTYPLTWTRAQAGHLYRRFAGGGVLNIRQDATGEWFWQQVSPRGPAHRGFSTEGEAKSAADAAHQGGLPIAR